MSTDLKAIRERDAACEIDEIGIVWHAHPTDVANDRRALLALLDEVKIAMKALATAHAQTIKDLGGCDHSVGICCCEDIRMVDEANELIAKLESK